LLTLMGEVPKQNVAISDLNCQPVVVESFFSYVKLSTSRLT
jgi:hypothetical protein